MTPEMYQPAGSPQLWANGRRAASFCRGVAGFPPQSWGNWAAPGRLTGPLITNSAISTMVPAKTRFETALERLERKQPPLSCRPQTPAVA